MEDTATGRLALVDARLLGTGALAGVLGGAVLFLVMGGYYAANDSSFGSMLSFCFAGFVYSLAASGMSGMGAGHGMGHHGSTTMMGGSTTMMGGSTTMMGGSTTMMAGSTTMASSHAMGGSHGMAGSHGMNMMMGAQPTSHLVVGTILHVGFSAFAGAAFAVVFALLVRAGLRFLASAAGYFLAGAAGGALLYVIMIYGVAPGLNPTIVDFTPRVPFFFAHLLFGATVGSFVYWRRHGVTSGVQLGRPIPSGVT